MSRKNIIEEVSKFNLHEQLVLLTSRYHLLNQEIEYINKLVQRYDMDWSMFLGIAMLNRVNGVVYKNIKDISNIPRYVKYFLHVAYLEQRERTKLHQNEILEIADVFEKEGINYAFLKGAVLNTVFYEPGDRISNDTDMMVNITDIDKAVTLLKDMGYIQGEVREGKLQPATKKEILFARLNTYEIVPLNKPVNERYLPFHEVDINFRLGNDDVKNNASKMLENTIQLKLDGHDIRTLSLEEFLIFLCIHHYREATMIFKIVNGDDITLYKFMDIHFFVSQKDKEIDWNKLLEMCQKMGRQQDVYYTLYYTEVLYPGTFELEILEQFKPKNIEYLNEYKGKDNSSEVYQWEMDFFNRAFSYKRRVEAMKNIEAENKRFEKIREQLKN